MKTFLDSGVLLTAWRGQVSPAVQTALTLLADLEREFVTCDNVKLELLPKPIYERRRVKSSSMKLISIPRQPQNHLAQNSEEPR